VARRGLFCRFCRSCRICRLLVGIAALAAITAPTSAQESRTLTLEQAIDLARRHNPAYQRALAQADATGADVRAGIGGFLPSVSADLRFGGGTQTVFTGTDDFGQPIERDDPLTSDNSSSTQSVNASLTLFDGFRNVNALRAANAGSDAMARQLEAEGMTLDRDVKQTFYAALQAQQLLGIEDRLLAARRQELDATERLFRVAGQTQVDVLGAQIELARQEQALETARGDARKRALELAETLGLEGQADLSVAGGFPEPFDPVNLDAEGLVARAASQHPRIAQASAAAAQARFQATAAHGARWPTLTASTGFSRQVRTQDFNSLFELDPPDRAFSFSLGVEIPIFSRFQTSQAITQASTQRVLAEENLRQERLAVEREVRSALIDLQNAYRNLQLAERSAELGRLRVQMAREQFQTGTIGFTNFQQIANSSANEERQELVARRNWANALATVEALVGRDVTP
jgi:outer membrane protein